MDGWEPVLFLEHQMSHPFPDPALRAFVEGMIQRHGVLEAARRLKLSRLATVNLARGGRCQERTLRKAREARIEIERGRVAA